MDGPVSHTLHCHQRPCLSLRKQTHKQLLILMFLSLMLTLIHTKEANYSVCLWQHIVFKNIPASTVTPNSTESIIKQKVLKQVKSCKAN